MLTVEWRVVNAGRIAEPRHEDRRDPEGRRREVHGELRRGEEPSGQFAQVVERPVLRLEADEPPPRRVVQRADENLDIDDLVEPEARRAETAEPQPCAGRENR